MTGNLINFCERADTKGLRKCSFQIGGECSLVSRRVVSGWGTAERLSNAEQA